MIIKNENRDYRQSGAMSDYILEKSDQILNIHKSGRVTLLGV